MRDVDPQIAAFVDEWHRCILHKDGPGAARLREEGYRSTLPNGAVLSRDEEVASIASLGYVVRALTVREPAVRRSGDRAQVEATVAMAGESFGAPFDADYRFTLELRRNGGEWRARSSRLEESAPHEAPRPAPLAARVKRAVRRLVRGPAATFQEVAYLPFQPGRDFAIPPAAAPAPSDADLPIPPRSLWPGEGYALYGKGQVETMLRVAGESGFTLAPGDRVLDVGCGVGRMIRHLRDLAATCEIWGTDISSEQIYWCKQNLSPPFHFVTNTKVPHLPFEDRSFDLIYCGSLFTHIDDLADAWLLELHRILAPDGRLYVTIHDSETVRLFETAAYRGSPLAAHVRARPEFQRLRDSFGMLTIGRDHESQVFYDTEYFRRMVAPMFEVLSTTPEAYFYQTAYLLKRKSRAAARSRVPAG